MGFTYTFDANGNRSGLVDAGAGVFTYQFDAVDQVTTIVNRFSETTSLVYDALGRSTKRILGNGVIGTYVHDSAGNQTGLQMCRVTRAPRTFIALQRNRSGVRRATLNSSSQAASSPARLPVSGFPQSFPVFIPAKSSQSRVTMQVQRHKGRERMSIMPDGHGVSEIAVCAVCGEACETKSISFCMPSSTSGLALVRNVPAEVCPGCGDTRFSLKTSVRVMAAVRQKVRPDEVVVVPVFDLDRTQ